MDERQPTAGSTSLSASPGSNQPDQTTIASAAPAPASMAEVIARRERSIADGILTNESLTADLDDDAAQQMIDWSLTMAREAVHQTAGLDEPQAEKVISERMYTQRKLVRAVKRLVLEEPSLDEKTRAELLDQIGVQSKLIYGEPTAQAFSDPRELLNLLREPDLRPGQAISRLRMALDPYSHPGDDTAPDNARTA